MTTLLNDFRFAARALRKRPGFLLLAVTTLALGIGANTSIFAIVDSILLTPLPYPDADRIVQICETNHAAERFCIASTPNVEDWAESSETLVALGVARSWPFIMGESGETEGIRGGLATSGAFEALAARAHIGRIFNGDDDLASGRAVLLSHSFWSSRMGADSAAVGSTVLLDGEPREIVGVLQPEFEMPELGWVQVWVSLPWHPRDEDNRDWRGFSAFGKLAAGSSLQDAQSELDAITRELAQRYPEANPGTGARVESLHDRVVGGARASLGFFFGVVALVLLIGCANVANLLMARATGRRREFAVRQAIGAGPRHLARLLLSESLLLSAAGGAVGVLLALWAVEGFRLLSPPGIPRVEEVSLGGGAISFTIVLIGATALIFGLAPLFGSARLDMTAALKEPQPSQGRSRVSAGDVLVLGEIAMAVVLVAGAGVLARSYINLTTWNPGFDREGLVTSWLLPPSDKYPTGEAVVDMFRRVQENVASVPGVESASLGSAGPLFGGVETTEIILEAGADPLAVRRYDMSPGYFETLGVPLAEGREFSWEDDGRSETVAIVNETLAGMLWPDDDPLGQTVTTSGGHTFTIVGVAADVTPFEAGTPVEPELYWPIAQLPRGAAYLIWRQTTDAAEAVAERAGAVDPDMSVTTPVPLEQIVDRHLVRPRFNMLLTGAFALTALLLALVGIYGVVSFVFAARTREIGIRMALGAERANIVGLVLRRGLLLALIGIALGISGSLMAGRFIAGLLSGVSPSDPTTLAVASLAVTGTVALATLIPALRASRVDPMEVLRQ